MAGGGVKWAQTYLDGTERSGADHRPNFAQLYRNNWSNCARVKTNWPHPTPDYLRSRSRSSAWPHSSASHSEATNEWKDSAKSERATSAAQVHPDYTAIACQLRRITVEQLESGRRDLDKGVRRRRRHVRVPITCEEGEVPHGGWGSMRGVGS